MADFSREVLDGLTRGKTKDEIFGPDGVLKQLTGALVNRLLEAEMEEHLGYEKGSRASKMRPNHRNGKSKKTVRSEDGPLEIDVPRDRDGTFEPEIVKKHERDIGHLKSKILYLYATGNTVRTIQGQLLELYNTEVSPDFISRVTAEVMEEVKAWRSRPLDAVYPIVYLDALVVKGRDQGVVKKRTVYVALGVTLEGDKEVLGLWIANNEGAKFWQHVITELKNRGLERIFFACVDGLNGFEEAIEAVFPETVVQTCVVHLIRNSMSFVSWKDRKTMSVDLRSVYTSPTAEVAEQALTDFGSKWDGQYPSVSALWRRQWARVIPFLAFPSEIRRVLYTTNAIESLNRQLRKYIKTRTQFPSDDAVYKALYLGLQIAAKNWNRSLRDWKRALQQMALHCDYDLTTAR